MQQKQTWVTLRDHPVESAAEFLIGSFQSSLRSRTVYVYAGEGHARITVPVQKTEPVPLSRLNGEGTGPLRLVRLTAGQLNFLRSQYLGANIVPAGGQVNIGVVWGEHLVGACSFSHPQLLGGKFCDVYGMSDFAVRPTIYARLAKLVLTAMVSTEMKALLEQAMNHRVDIIATTCFTDKPVSQKYRGLFQLHSRKEGKLNYTAHAGRWTLAEGLAWWKKTHGNARIGGGSREGAAPVPTGEGNSTLSPRSTSDAEGAL